MAPLPVASGMTNDVYSSRAQQVRVFAVGSAVDSYDVTARVDPVCISRGSAGRIDRCENAALEQKPMVPGGVIVLSHICIARRGHIAALGGRSTGEINSGEAGTLSERHFLRAPDRCEVKYPFFVSYVLPRVIDSRIQNYYRAEKYFWELRGAGEDPVQENPLGGASS